MLYHEHSTLFFFVSFEVDIMCAQKISCEGCGSKWAVIGIGNQILARLVECPLCSEEKLD